MPQRTRRTPRSARLHGSALFSVFSLPRQASGLSPEADSFSQRVRRTRYNRYDLPAFKTFSELRAEFSVKRRFCRADQTQRTPKNRRYF